MAIVFQEKERLFTLHTASTTYQMKVDGFGYLLHLYYGDRSEGSMEYLLTYADRGFSGNPYEAEEDRTCSLDALPQEYPSQGAGDYRSPALIVRNADGACSADLRYAGHRILDGKYGLEGLPAAYGDADGKSTDGSGDQDAAQTLEIDLKDAASGLTVTLLYGVLPDKDVITRAVRLKNTGSRPVELLKVQSACLDFTWGEYDWIQFYGRHAMERTFERAPLRHGAQVIGSRRGTSSHQYNPFVILAERETTETAGGCWGLSFVYSGSFKAEAEMDQYCQTRVSMGLQDEAFSWPLAPGGTFTAPEVMMSYSGRGLGQLSRNYHRAIRHNVCRGKYKTMPRPVLINNWEVTYFDFDGGKIMDIARQAAELGVEMLVLDDGWFGKRNSDTCGLGDWYVNEEKLGGSLAHLAEQINGLGMKFGLWMEPEMVSEDSDLYRQHPDWAFAVPGKKPVRSRYQLVLDFSRREVVDHVYEQLSHVLDSANIEYVKWDMNRSICDVWSAAAGSAKQGQILHKYVLGLYDFLERINKNYPDLFIEGCSGGGGRFDAGMLYYTPQIWCSDNTDAIDRLRIQHGTSFGYPISAVGSHVSAVPNHQNGRTTSIETRGCVAMAGSFGYELDLNKITPEEKECVKAQISRFHELWELIHNGDYYRLTDPGRQGLEGEAAAWMFVREDRSEALVSAVTLDYHGNSLAPLIRLQGLDPKAVYRDAETGRQYAGAALMCAGVPLPLLGGEYRSWEMHLVREQEQE
ncbi:MAG: alpha-galactosidase [Eubacteriales bacterium]|nr:alpha-galactosidase [Eubacteriales bacterium]